VKDKRFYNDVKIGIKPLSLYDVCAFVARGKKQKKFKGHSKVKRNICEFLQEHVPNIQQEKYKIKHDFKNN